MVESRGHRTQAQRREQTRRALLDATVDCLVELGYARTSMQEICSRAGVSKGAAQHHFTDKAELMAAAVEHLTTKRMTALAESLGKLPRGADAIPAAIDMLWAGYSGALATASTELWIAARTDPALRAAIRPVDRAMGRSALASIKAIAEDLPADQVETLFWLTVNLTRGLALDAELGGAPARRKQLLEEWKRVAVQHASEG
ncbi:TetR/AcrR family transcriptional regulator [Amycolatopsis acidiphila]|uniref:TetR family transcriptional regulator n=1 Tax=Amycolatopsis acidiphila TaxID=715473 RepID=A0A558AEU0_9PSEU|nr:TetR/AcrR family transcriptional regulator [Amycolatopsis acidiphila]TVT22778.1 TetR family transcriptional regulator [Amycolatopsis acidiphila]UIJ58210.1 TetR/AcrR family transcriptional regulator [Amycolatopsis acidiphila]GHG69392.1 TetR family transcriptional regulator [Amycolatopsis acidiphila]